MIVPLLDTITSHSTIGLIEFTQSYLHPHFRYNGSYKSALKAVWETLFLCFPVVTTTLYSFDMKKFPMIQGIFDTLLIDEAGQSALHTVIGPLYRFRKAIIVGDVFQLQPIHVHKNNIINKYTCFSNSEKKI